MKYPLMPDQTVEYLVLHALECGMPDVWSMRKHLLLRGPDDELPSNDQAKGPGGSSPGPA